MDKAGILVGRCILGIALAFALANCDREARQAAANHGKVLELARDPAGPEGATELGPMLVDSEMLEGLHRIEIASRLSQTSIQN